MKAIVIMLTAALALGGGAPDAAAREQSEQHPELRNLKLAVRNKRGRAMADLPLVAQIKGGGEARTLDRFGNAFFDVSDADTLLVVVADEVWEFPLGGLDSLHVVFKNRRRIAGYTAGDGSGELLDVGYGTVSRRNNTSSVSQLDMRGSESYTDLRSYIMGRVPGLTFIGSKMVIRGINSINSGTDPLVVLDGMVMNGSFETINGTVSPHDVESVSVLKDAAATSIYGVRGANGVVLIRTKTGNSRR